MKKIVLIILIIILGSLGSLVLAQTQNPPIPLAVEHKCPTNLNSQGCIQWALNQASSKADLGTAGYVESTIIAQTVGTIISYILGFLGVIFLVITVYSGIQWMTAGGNEEKVTKARTRLINATVGLVIIMAAYAITWFVTSKIKSSITPYTPPEPCTTQSEAGYEFSCVGSFTPPSQQFCEGQGGTVITIYSCPPPQNPQDPLLVCCKIPTP